MNEMTKIIICKVSGFLILLAGLWIKNSQTSNDQSAQSSVFSSLDPMIFFVLGFSLVAYSWYIFYKEKKRRDNTTKKDNN